MVDLSVGGLIALCSRHRALLGVWVSVILSLTALIVFSLQRQYRAEAMLILDTRVEHVSDFRSVVSTPFTVQDAAPIIRSEVQILSSPDLAGKIIDKLDLANNPAFEPNPSGTHMLIIGALRGLRSLCPPTFGNVCGAEPDAPPDPTRMRNALIDTYLRHLSVYNDGKSFSLSISFESSDPKLAALIANTHADLYLADQRAFKRSASVRGVAWIGRQIIRLGTDLDSKEQELAKFRETAGLVVAAQGATMVAQQITQLDTELATAKADLAQRQARLAGTQSAMRGGIMAAQSTVINSPLIQRLREQQTSAQQDLADQTRRHGPSYPGTQQVNARLDEVNRAIEQEVQRIVVAVDGDSRMAGQRVAQLEETLVALRTQLVEQDRAASRFTEMERDVAALRGVYQGLLARQQELDAQAGTEDADARLVSSATEPLTPFFPNKTMLFGIATMMAGVSGVGLAFLADRPGRGIESHARLEDMVGLRSMHALPLVTTADRGAHALTDLFLDHPKAEFAEAIRTLRGDIEALRRQKSIKVLAITSALSREGKTSVAVALARSLALSGLSVLLIDCDLRRPRAAGLVGVARADRGIVDVLAGACRLDEATVQDLRSNLSVLPVERAVTSPQDLLGGAAFRDLLATAKSKFDFVVLDTPPEGAVSDSLVIAERADATILLVRWRSTPASIVRSTLQSFQRRGIVVDGIFLNAVDQRSLTRYDADLRIAYRSARAYYANS